MTGIHVHYAQKQPGKSALRVERQRLAEAGDGAERLVQCDIDRAALGVPFRRPHFAREAERVKCLPRLFRESRLGGAKVDQFPADFFTEGEKRVRGAVVGREFRLFDRRQRQQKRVDLICVGNEKAPAVQFPHVTGAFGERHEPVGAGKDQLRADRGHLAEILFGELGIAVLEQRPRHPEAEPLEFRVVGVLRRMPVVLRRDPAVVEARQRRFVEFHMGDALPPFAGESTVTDHVVRLEKGAEERVAAEADQHRQRQRRRQFVGSRGSGIVEHRPEAHEGRHVGAVAPAGKIPLRLLESPRPHQTARQYVAQDVNGSVGKQAENRRLDRIVVFGALGRVDVKIRVADAAVVVSVAKIDELVDGEKLLRDDADILRRAADHPPFQRLARAAEPEQLQPRQRLQFPVGVERDGSRRHILPRVVGILEDVGVDRPDLRRSGKPLQPQLLQQRGVLRLVRQEFFRLEIRNAQRQDRIIDLALISEFLRDLAHGVHPVIGQPHGDDQIAERRGVAAEHAERPLVFAVQTVTQIRHRFTAVKGVAAKLRVQKAVVRIDMSPRLVRHAFDGVGAEEPIVIPDLPVRIAPLRFPTEYGSFASLRVEAPEFARRRDRSQRVFEIRSVHTVRPELVPRIQHRDRGVTPPFDRQSEQPPPRGRHPGGALPLEKLVAPLRVKLEFEQLFVRRCHRGDFMVVDDVIDERFQTVGGDVQIFRRFGDVVTPRLGARHALRQIFPKFGIVELGDLHQMGVHVHVGKSGVIPVVDQPRKDRRGKDKQRKRQFVFCHDDFLPYDMDKAGRK